MKVLYRSAVLLLILFMAGFGAANRGLVTVGWFPLPFVVDMPLYLVFFAGLVIGVLVSGVVTGLKRLNTGRRARKAEREVKALRTSVASLEEQLDDDPDPKPAAETKALAKP